MYDFVKETERIYRLKVPFMSVYTSVFLVISGKTLILVDCATTAQDVKEHIVPALGRLGYTPSDVGYLVLTHGHEDHAGGLDALRALAPGARVVREEASLCDGIATYSLRGHTCDCIGLLDEEEGTLITGDGIQGAGIGKFRCSLESKSGYLATLERLKADTRITTLLLSHEYEPWYRDSIRGRRQIEACLADCLDYVK